MISLNKWAQPFGRPVMACLMRAHMSSNSGWRDSIDKSQPKHVDAGVSAHKSPGRGPDHDHIHGESSPVQQSYPGAACWACDAIFVPENERFCNSCHKLQPLIPHSNYFELFKCQVAFEIDTEQLEKQFQILQKMLHPDRFFMHTEPEQSHATDHSSEINEAYQTLRKPMSRAKYLMAMEGVDLEEAVSKTVDDMELLMEMMELREFLDENPSNSEVQNRLAPYSDEIRRLYKEFAEAYQEKHLQKATSILTRAMYIQKVLDDA